MNSNQVTALVGVVGFVIGFLVGALVYSGGLPGFGRASGFAHYQVESFLQGLAAGQRDQFVIENDGDIVSTADATFDDLTVSGADLVVTTANTATSSVEAGCWQLTATSTASPLKAVPAAISTTTTTFGHGTSGFPLVAVPGTCP